MTTSHSELGIIPVDRHEAAALPDTSQRYARPYSKAPGESAPSFPTPRGCQVIHVYHIKFGCCLLGKMSKSNKCSREGWVGLKGRGGVKQNIEGIRETLSPSPTVSSWLDTRWITKRKPNTLIDTSVVYAAHGSMECLERSDSKR